MKGLRRRQLLTTAAGATGLGALAYLYLHRSDAEASGADRLRADPEGILDLADGLSYRVLQRAGEPMTDGFTVPGLADGMTCLAAGDGAWVLLRNHELSPNHASHCAHPGQAPPPEAFDAASFGAVTRVVVDPRSLAVVSSNLVLTGTNRNCGGGPSPWGWISCEEDVSPGHGYAFLCPVDADRVRPAKQLPGYGRFRHEAVAVDPRTHVAYLTEDRADGCLYRFVPNDPSRPFEGKLQALAHPDGGFDTASMVRGDGFAVQWVDLPEPSPNDDSLRLQAAALGAAQFRRGEGIFLLGDRVVFAATTGGPADCGQLFELDTARESLRVIAAAEDRSELDGPDNITIAPWGDVIIAEDGGDTQFLRAVDDQGKNLVFARNAISDGELAGVCFSPDGTTLFVNLQREGMTFAITGDFERALSV